MAETLEELVWEPGAAGVGALLVTEEGLPRDEFGHPYQPLFWFDDANRPIGLVRDRTGRVLAYRNNRQGDPLLSGPPRCQRVPEAVEAAAQRWWAGQREASE